MRSSIKAVLGLFIFFLLAGLGYGSFYTVTEGHVGIVKRFAKAVAQTDPGLRFKIPIIEQVHEMEVRQRKNKEELAAATKNQLPVTAIVSINWTVNKAAAMEMYIKYGGLAQFEERVLDPKLRNVVKTVLAHYPPDVLIRDRTAAVSEIMVAMVDATKDLPIAINAPQIENISLPTAYLQAIQDKERAREAAMMEKHNLEKQRLVAMQEVNSAEANKQATVLRAGGQAEAKVLTATAEAKAIEMVNKQLAKSPLYIDLVRAKAWNGILPTTMLGSNTTALMALK